MPADWIEPGAHELLACYAFEATPPPTRWRGFESMGDLVWHRRAPRIAQRDITCQIVSGGRTIITQLWTDNWRHRWSSELTESRVSPFLFDIGIWNEVACFAPGQILTLVPEADDRGAPSFLTGKYDCLAVVDSNIISVFAATDSYYAMGQITQWALSYCGRTIVSDRDAPRDAELTPFVMWEMLRSRVFKLGKLAVAIRRLHASVKSRPEGSA